MISRDMEQEKLRHAKSSGTSIAEKTFSSTFNVIRIRIRIESVEPADI